MEVIKLMDIWEFEYDKRYSCPVCDFLLNLNEIKYLKIEDFRHCPNCGERLLPPKEDK